MGIYWPDFCTTSILAERATVELFKEQPQISIPANLEVLKQHDTQSMCIYTTASLHLCTAKCEEKVFYSWVEAAPLAEVLAGK